MWSNDTMASISKVKGGSWMVQFKLDNGRKTVRLGKVAKREAEQIKSFVERLVAAKMLGTPLDGATAAWLGNIGDSLSERLAKAGLIERIQFRTVAEFCREYIDKRTDVSPGTILTYEQTYTDLVGYFGRKKMMHAVTREDAEAWRLWLMGNERGLAKNSANMRCAKARVFFGGAKKAKVTTINPFTRLDIQLVYRHDRFVFVPRSTITDVLEACPDHQWRLIVALSRFGGLRCPSEVLRLKWGDVNWERDRFTVISSKLSNHTNGGRRLVPIFPELKPHMEAAWDMAEDGDEYVITKYRGGEKNLRTVFNKIVGRAGYEPWEKPFQNMRSSRESELVDQFPLPVVCKWIGNSPKVAEQHYLQQLEKDFERAASTQTALDTKPADFSRSVKRRAKTA